MKPTFSLADLSPFERKIYERLILEFETAYKDARRGKRETRDEYKFEVNEIVNLEHLAYTVVTRKYRPGRSTAHVVFKPVIREIFAAPFRDRVIHHFIYNNVYPWWDKRFIYDSYSCREGKGTLFGVKRLQHHIDAVSKGFTVMPWVFKFDIQGYFMSLPRKGLLDRAVWGLDRQFPASERGWRYETLKFLWEQVIMDDPCKGARRIGWPEDWADVPESKCLFLQEPGRGIVIGNQTSQVLSNIYLDQLDRFMTHELGFSHYGRYVDDFYIVVPPEELTRAHEAVPLIENYLKAIGLTLHPKKRYIQPASRGVPFLGCIVYPGRILPGKRIVRNMNEAFSEVAGGARDVESVASYMGHLKHIKSDTEIAKAFKRVGWEYFAGEF